MLSNNPSSSEVAIVTDEHAMATSGEVEELRKELAELKNDMRAGLAEVMDALHASNENPRHQSTPSAPTLSSPVSHPIDGNTLSNENIFHQSTASAPTMSRPVAHPIDLTNEDVNTMEHKNRMKRIIYSIQNLCKDGSTEFAIHTPSGIRYMMQHERNALPLSKGNGNVLTRSTYVLP